MDGPADQKVAGLKLITIMLCKPPWAIMMVVLKTIMAQAGSVIVNIINAYIVYVIAMCQLYAK